MKTTVNKFDFVRAFDTAGRGNNFSRAAREALFDYLEELEQDSGEEMELDVIAICCDWEEYELATEAADGRDFRSDLTQTEEEQEEEALEYLRDNTTALEIEGGGVLIQSF